MFGKKFSTSRGSSLFLMGLVAVFFVLGSLAFLAGADRFVSSVFAASFNPPSAQPPEGNIPVTVWNRLDSTEKQAAASIEIDGGGPAEDSGGVATGKPVGISVGDVGLNMGKNFGGQNLYYGFAPYANMNAQDRLMLLQTSDSGVWTNRFSVDRDGNLWASGCFGPMVQGVTSANYTGSLNGLAPNHGYFSANAICEAKFSGGGHVCSTAEVLNSIKCKVTALAGGALDGVDAWIQDGPPGFTSPANDCQGWRSNAANHLGRMWRFDPDNGGQGFLTTCNQSIAFACCR